MMWCLNWRDVAKVPDGDTVHVYTYWLERIATKKEVLKLRLGRIDASDKEPAKKKAGDYLRKRIGRTIRAELGKEEKYGRTLAEIYKWGVNVNDAMVRNGYADYYDGGKR